jgi:two-component system response regulator AtoC
MAGAKVLILEDEKLIRWSLRERLSREGHDVVEAETAREGLARLREDPFDLLLLDYKLPDKTGLDVLRTIRKTNRDTVVIMITAYGTIETAVEAMKLGAFEYLLKPFDMDEMALVVERALETSALRREVSSLRSAVAGQYGFEKILGRSPAMHELLETIQEVAKSPSSTVFLRGESGTGKDLVARTIHYQSDRGQRPFVNITCTALTETLLESELFGHERGSFTGATTTKKGLLEVADGGTVFLDEVGDMPAGVQAKLLRFLEEKTFRRVGGTTDSTVNVRIIAATNRDIEQAVRDKHFREDLFFRLNIITVFLPPLREREGDVQLLAEHFVELFAREFKRPVHRITPAAMELLKAHPWPGNVRELRNVIERAVLLSKSEVLGPEDVALLRGLPVGAEGGRLINLPPGGVDIQEVERDLVMQALAMTANNQTRASKLLRISRDQLRYRMDKYGLL